MKTKLNKFNWKIYLVIASVFLGGTGYYLIVLRPTNFNQSPFQIEIDNYKDRYLSVSDIRDRRSIAAFLSMLVQTSDYRVSKVKSGPATYHFHIPPAGKSSYKRHTKPIWQMDDGNYVWSNGRAFYQLNGNLELYLKCLKARRISQLLMSNDVHEQELGRQLRELYQDLREALLELTKSQNIQLQQYANSTLDEFNSKVPERPEALAKYSPGSYQTIPVKRSIEKGQMEILKKYAEEIDKGLYSESHNAIFDIISNIGPNQDPDVAKTTLELLDKYPNTYLASELIQAVKRIYGLPPMEMIGICGNSSPSEQLQFSNQEKERLANELKKTTAWIEHNSLVSDKERLKNTLIEWFPVFQRLIDVKNPYQTASYPLHYNELSNLLELPIEIVDAADELQQEVADINIQGMLEFIKASFTGMCDTDIVNELIQGDQLQQIIACKIIIVSHNTDRQKWTNSLKMFLVVEHDYKDVDITVMLRSLASEALYSCLGIDGLEEIRIAFEQNYTNQTGSRMLNWCFVPK